MEKVKGLKCRECGRGYPVAPLHVCEFCFGPLEVDYHYEAIRTRVSRDRIAAGPPSIWRYQELLSEYCDRFGGSLTEPPCAAARG